MTDHAHSQYVAGCFRCDLSRDEVTSGFITEAVIEQATLSDLNLLRVDWNALAPLTAIVQAAKVEALREAADEFWARLPDGTGNGRAYNSHRVADMLRDRADRIEQGAQS